MEFGSLVMLRVTDKLQGGLMQDRSRAYGWGPGSTPVSILCRGDQMVSCFVLVRFEESLEQFKSRIWTVSSANSTHTRSSTLEKFELLRACVAPPTASRANQRSRSIQTGPPCGQHHESHVGETRPPRQLWQVQSSSQGQLANDTWPYDRLQEAGQRHDVPAPSGAGE